MTDTTDRDAAPAAAEGADLRERLLMRLGSHQRFCSICRGKQPGFVCQWEQGMLNALEVYDAARPAPAATPAEGADAMVEEIAQALHSLLWHHGPQPYSDRVYRWRDCHDPYCVKMRAVVAARPAPVAAPAAADGADLSIRLIDRLESHQRFCSTCLGKRPGYVCQWEQGLLTALEIVEAARPAPAAAPRAGGELFTEAELRTYAENLLAMGSGPHAASGRSILAMVQFLTTSHRQAARETPREGGEHRCVGCRSGLCEIPDARLCDDCQQGVSHKCGDECRHRSDCALHNEPATPNGPCNCHLARDDAPREGGVVGAVLGELEWRHWSTRDGSERMCLVCERDEPEGHAPECRMAAAIEAARGDAYEGTYHRPIVDASGHELVGDGTP